MTLPVEAIIALLTLNGTFLGLICHLGIGLLKSLNKLELRFGVFEAKHSAKEGHHA